MYTNFWTWIFRHFTNFYHFFQLVPSYCNLANFTPSASKTVLIPSFDEAGLFLADNFRGAKVFQV